MYVGHWKVCGLEVRDFRYLKNDRCAVIRFRLDRFDEEFAEVIAAACQKKTGAEIANLGLSAPASARAAAKKKRKVTPEKAPKRNAPTKKSLSLRSASGSSRASSVGRSRAKRHCIHSVSYTEPEETDDDDFMAEAQEQEPPRKRAKKPRRDVNLRRSSAAGCNKEQQKRRTSSRLCAKQPPRAPKESRPAPKDAIIVPKFRRFSRNESEDSGTTETQNLPVVFAGRPDKKNSSGRRKSSATKKKPPPASPAASAAPEVVDLTQSDDDTATPQNGRDYWAWSSSRRPAARKGTAKLSPTKAQQQHRPVSSQASTSSSPALRATESESTANSESATAAAAAGNDSKPPALTFFRIHVRGVTDDSIGQSVGVPSRADMTFRTVREAIETQLVPHRFGRDATWHFFVPSLGMIFPSQEGWKLIPLLEAGTGRASDPYKTTIIIN